MEIGFVPDSFLPENTMLLNLIQAWAEDEREELYLLFLDMEKAFDRCSHEYMMEALGALGFGPNFVQSVKLMYDANNPPTRRIYANGYYSDWFPIKSGVAQGCPLSPLLFLVVAEGLKISLDMERGFKGIKIGGKYYKLSQFADDTTLILGDMSQLRHAEAGIQRWCRATGMRENVSKREGLLSPWASSGNSTWLQTDLHRYLRTSTGKRRASGRYLWVSPLATTLMLKSGGRRSSRQFERSQRNGQRSFVPAILAET